MGEATQILLKLSERVIRCTVAPDSISVFELRPGNVTISVQIQSRNKTEIFETIQSLRMHLKDSGRCRDFRIF